MLLILFYLCLLTEFAASLTWLGTDAEVEAVEPNQHQNYVDKALEEMRSFASSENFCVQQALGDLLSKCRITGMEVLDLDTKKYSALSLTLCEMRSLGVNIPEGCQQLLTRQMSDNCISELEKIPQYWTTYSGNYREIRKICFEESLPHEKTQIVALYSNITKVFQKLQKNVIRSLDVNEDMQKSAADKIAALQQLMQDFASNVHEASYEMKSHHSESLKMVQDMFQTSLKVVSSLSTDTETIIGELAVNLNFLNMQFSQMKHELSDDSLVKQVVSMKQQISKNVAEAVEEVSGLTGNIRKDTQEANSHLQERNKQLSKDLEVNAELAHNINDVLKAAKTNAIEQASALSLNSHNIEQAVGQLFYSLDGTITNLKLSIDSYIEELDAKVAETLNGMTKVNSEIRILSSYLSKVHAFYRTVTSRCSHAIETLVSVYDTSFVALLLQKIRASGLILANIYSYFIACAAVILIQRFGPAIASPTSTSIVAVTCVSWLVIYQIWYSPLQEELMTFCGDI